MFKYTKRILFVALVILLATAQTVVLAANGAAKFQVTQKVFVAGNEIKAGVYDVKWEATDADATVTFINRGDVIAKVQAKVEEINQNFDYNSLVMGKDSSGREAIKGLQFKGNKVRIIFE